MNPRAPLAINRFLAFVRFSLNLCAMPVATRTPTASKSRFDARQPFTESKAWQSIGEGWRQLHGSYRDVGFSFEWHDFTLAKDMEWGRTFHPGSIEICLNLMGRGTVIEKDRRMDFAPLTAGFYWQDRQRLQAR